MADFVSGAITMAYLVAGLYFLRFWRDTHDRLFAFFTAAFFIFAVQRTLLAHLSDRELLALAGYGLRLVAFLLILVAVVDKNRKQ